MLAGLASAPPPIPGALEDDPLTSPSFSLKADTAADSRSYSNSRKHAKTTATPGIAAGHAAGNGTTHGNANGNGGYPAADYASPGYAYQAAPPAAPADQWYSSPPAPAEPPPPAYGNPYQHSGPASPSADSHATAGYGGYLADPLRVYSPPGHEAPVQYADPASPGYQPLPPSGLAPQTGSMPYADGYSQHPYQDQPAHPDEYAPGGYTPGYEGGHGGDPYAAGGYGPYRSQG